MSILAYHIIDSKFTWGVTRVTPHLFSRQIDLLIAAGKQFVTISDYVLFNESDRLNKIAITFDDGYESVFTHAFPILKNKGILASVFVNPVFVGQYNTWDANFGKRIKHMDWHQIQRLEQAGWEIGSHGLTHQDLTHLSPFRLQRELFVSQRLIRKRIGHCSSVFSFPFGNSNNRVRQRCRESGYKHALVMGKAPRAGNVRNIWTRNGIYLFDVPFLFKYKVLAKSGFFLILLKRVFNACSNLTVMAKSKKWNIDKN